MGGFNSYVDLTYTNCPLNAICNFYNQNGNIITYAPVDPSGAPVSFFFEISTTVDVALGSYTTNLKATKMYDTSPTSNVDVTTTVQVNPSAFCTGDNKWRDIPYLVPGNTFSVVQNTTRLRLFSDAVFGALGGLKRVSCDFGGSSVCLWNDYAESTNLSGPSSADSVYAENELNVFVKQVSDAWIWNSNWGYKGSSSLYNSFWGTPTSVEDKFGNLWNFQKSGSKVQYECGPVDCTTLVFESATSGFPTNPNGPAQASLSVNPTTIFYAFVDYGQIIDFIRPPLGCPNCLCMGQCLDRNCGQIQMHGFGCQQFI